MVSPVLDWIMYLQGTPDRISISHELAVHLPLAMVVGAGINLNLP